MRTEEKYRTDANFAQLVNTIEAALHNAVYTPSEVREAAIYACIRYELTRPMQYVVPADVKVSLDILERYAKDEKNGMGLSCILASPDTDKIICSRTGLECVNDNFMRYNAETCPLI